jgi:hypothetical protein
VALGLGSIVVSIAHKSAGVKLAATVLFSMSNHTILRFAVPSMLFATGLALAGSFSANQKAVPMEQPTSTE